MREIHLVRRWTGMVSGCCKERFLEAASRRVPSGLLQFWSESFETEMRNQFLLCKKEDTVLLLVDPDRNVSFLGRISN